MKRKNCKKEKSLECPVRDAEGKKIETVLLNSKVFNGVVNIPLLHQVVTMYNANKRSGSASTKTKGQVRGGGKKPWRQKGTGRARTGSIRNPLWRGGGIIFGPKPRDFGFTVPKEMKRVALKSSLNEKFLDDKLVIIDQIKLDEPKTKLFSQKMSSLGVAEGEKTIVVVEKIDRNIKLASKNIPNINVKTLNDFNAMDILKASKIIIQHKSLETLMKGLQ